MSYETPVAPSLLDLIGRTWALPGGVTDACFNRDGSAVAFAGGGGSPSRRSPIPSGRRRGMRRAADTGRQIDPAAQEPGTPGRRGARASSGPSPRGGAKSFLTGGAQRRAGLGDAARTGGAGRRRRSMARARARARSEFGGGGGRRRFGLVLLPDDAGEPQRRTISGSR